MWTAVLQLIFTPLLTCPSHAHFPLSISTWEPQQPRRKNCRKHGFPRAVAERPAMKSSEGRHYRQFLQEGVMQFGRHVSSILVTFWCPWVPLATLGGTLGPRPDVFTICCPFLVAAGGVRGSLGTPCGPPWVPRCRQRSHFCRLFGDLGAEPQFSSRSGRKKEAKGSIFRRG